MTKCAVAFRRGLLLGLFATAAFAAMALWAANALHARPSLGTAQVSTSR